MTNKDFETFKKTFGKYLKLFGLTGWTVFYEHKPLGEHFAQIAYVLGDRNVIAMLNSKIPQGLIAHKDIKRDAKHEAIHLLLARLAAYATQRHITQGELDEAEEEVVVKLEGLIK